MATNTPQQIVYQGPNDLQVIPQEKPSIESGQVLVEVEAVAICGSDLKTWKNGNPRVQPPHTMGHEFCGRIVEVASDVTNWRPDQRITMATSIGCGQCYYCRHQQSNLCTDLRPIGFYYPGAMAHWVKLPAQAVQGNFLVDVGSLAAELGAR